MGRTGAVYFLVAGRWFSAPDFTGPWTFATPTLPADFKQIPLEHERSRVLASVPGTTQAAEAVLLAQVPQTARVEQDRAGARGRVPGWPARVPADREDDRAARGQHRQGHPQGRRPLLHVLPGRLVHVEDADRAVGGHRRGPNAIYEIPVSSPSHSVTYVTVEESNDDAVVFATAAAFTGVMVAWGCAVWGTGYYYPPYVGYGGMYPDLLPALSDATGSAHRTTRGPAPTHAARWPTVRTAAPASAQRYNPRTGTYSRGAVAYGPYGARGAAPGVQPAHRRVRRDPAGLERVRQLGTNGRRAGRRLGDHVAIHQQRHRQHDARDDADQRGRRGSQPAAGPAAAERLPRPAAATSTPATTATSTARRRQLAEVRQGGWNSVEPTAQQRQQAQDRASQTGAQARDSAAASGWDSTTQSQVTRDSAARAEGAQRTRDSGSVRSGTTSSSGSYRPSGASRGGASRGGGRRR